MSLGKCVKDVYVVQSGGFSTAAMFAGNGAKAVLRTATPTPTLPRAWGAGEGARCAADLACSDGLRGFRLPLRVRIKKQIFLFEAV